jgi:Fe-S-cluster containining protein
VITDLVEIRALANAKALENLRFRRYLKAHRCLFGPFRRIAREVAAQIDCTQCANCCRETRVNVSCEEIAAIARRLALEPAQVVDRYTVKDPEDGRAILRQSGGACVFLSGSLCTVYQDRPRACRGFPYLLAMENSLGSRMSSIFRRAWMCPVVYNTLEAYKRLVGYHPPVH